MITKEVIERFFRKECLEEEYRLVKSFLEENPEILDRYFDEQEWLKFEIPEEMPIELSEKIRSKVASATSESNRGIRTFRKIGIAASVIVLLALGRWIFQKLSGTGQRVQLAKSELTAGGKQKLNQVSNTSRRVMKILLTDGSAIFLHPESEVSYDSNFGQYGDRIVRLKGKALFKVARNKNKPFRVIAGDLSVMALGTSFTVCSYTDNGNIEVELHQGKVMIRSTSSAAEKLKKDYYLDPGDRLVYNKVSVKATLYKNRIRIRKNDKITSSKIKKSSVIRPAWYRFTGTSLEKVLQQLEVYYGIEIHYISSDIKNDYFSGEFKKTDSLVDILNDIALMNNLIVIKKADGFYIQANRY